MFYHIKNIIIRTIVPLLCMAMTACSDDDGVDAIAKNDVRVAFTMMVADAASTRAANEGWDNYVPKQPGIEDENMIDTETTSSKVTTSVAKATEVGITIVRTVRTAGTVAERAAWSARRCSESTVVVS